MAVEAPLPQALTYSAHDSLDSKIMRGQRVKVPLGRSKATGVILDRVAADDPELQKNGLAAKVKNILEIQADLPVLPDHYLSWLQWLSEYYLYPPGLVASLAFPPLERSKFVRASKRPTVVQVPTVLPPRKVLNQNQRAVVEAIQAHSGFKPHLLFGVTGSGKTEVYLELLESVLKQNQQGLVLVPEISLTPQLTDRFAKMFGDQIAVLHSQLSDRERTKQWWDMVEGRKQILIGARSAMFCPLPNLGLVVVDEEHEPSFKQDEHLKYQGRDAAVALAKFSKCPVVLGSATPSLESWQNARSGRYQLHELPERVENRSLPTVSVVNMRDEKKRPDRSAFLPDWMSEDLYKEMNSNLEKKQQTVLFLNRRGIAPLVLCEDCGFVLQCPNCDISLTLHGRSHLVCHYCDFQRAWAENCTSCKVGHFRALGIGTELLEQDVVRVFPGVRVARADRDEIQTRGQMEDLIRSVEEHRVDVLVGTQMIAKGLDFPRVTLVAVVAADVGFHLPDFRATERSYQLMAQVGGRSGRHVGPDEIPGRVILQTYNPDHPAIRFAQTNSFTEFAGFELEERQELGYPPFGRLVSLRIQGAKIDRVHNANRSLLQRAQSVQRRVEVYRNIEVLGPAPAPLAKLRGNYRFHLLLKSTRDVPMHRFVRQILGDLEWVPPGVRIVVDVDPQQLL